MEIFYIFPEILPLVNNFVPAGAFHSILLGNIILLLGLVRCAQMRKDPLAVLLGQNILRLRKEAGMTQAQLAEQINVGTTFISRVERGEKYVSIKGITTCFMVQFRRWMESVLTTSI